MAILGYFLKLLISALMIVTVSELAKRSGWVGGLIKSLPIISILSFIWLYLETRCVEKVSVLSTSTFWFVLPSLPMFLVLPWLLRLGFGFWASLGLALAFLCACYAAAMGLFQYFKIQAL